MAPIPPDELEHRLQEVENQQNKKMEVNVNKAIGGAVWGPGQRPPITPTQGHPMGQHVFQPGQQEPIQQQHQYQGLTRASPQLAVQPSVQPYPQQQQPMRQIPHQHVNQRPNVYQTHSSPPGQRRQDRVYQRRDQHHLRRNEQIAAHLGRGVPNPAQTHIQQQQFVPRSDFQFNPQVIPVHLTQPPAPPSQDQRQRMAELALSVQMAQNSQRALNQTQVPSSMPLQAGVAPIPSQHPVSQPALIQEYPYRFNPYAVPLPDFGPPIYLPLAPRQTQSPKQAPPTLDEWAAHFENRLKQSLQNPMGLNIAAEMALEMRLAIGDSVGKDSPEYEAYSRRKRYYFQVFVRFISDNEPSAPAEYIVLGYLLIGMQGQHTIDPDFVFEVFLQTYKSFREDGKNAIRAERLYSFMRTLCLIQYRNDGLMRAFGPPPLKTTEEPVPSNHVSEPMPQNIAEIMETHNGEPISLAAFQFWGQPTQQPISQPPPQHMPQPMATPMTQHLPQPMVQPMVLPNAQPVVRPVGYSIPQPRLRSMPQSTPELAQQHLGQPMPQPVPNSIGLPGRHLAPYTTTMQPVAQPIQQPTQQPVQQFLRQPAPQARAPTMMMPPSPPSTQSTQQATGEPTRQTTPQPIRQLAPQVMQQPIQRPIQEPMQQPQQQPVQQPIEQPIQQPVQHPVQQPAEQPTQQYAHQQLIPGTPQPPTAASPPVSDLLPHPTQSMYDPALFGETALGDSQFDDPNFNFDLDFNLDAEFNANATVGGVGGAGDIDWDMLLANDPDVNLGSEVDGEQKTEEEEGEN
ncbi:hypothetical protein F5B19DRAFT_496805 [Rostrohypoxylon terebratum]|nr:hypothetical protein F5B19DRAFT_496805 [Rostrohypoxylon terebratum]